MRSIWDALLDGLAGVGSRVVPGKVYEPELTYQHLNETYQASYDQYEAASRGFQQAQQQYQQQRQYNAAFYQQFEYWRQQQGWYPPPPVAIQPWRATLGLPPSGPITIEDVDSAFKVMAKKHHPDCGGDVEKMKELNAARNQAKQELGA